MISISNRHSPCNHSIVSYPAVQTLEEGLRQIHALLEKELLCRHAICSLNNAYEVVYQQEPASHTHSQQILNEIAGRVNQAYEAVETYQLINAYYLQDFKGLLIRDRPAPCINGLVDHVKMKEIATHLSACIEQNELEADAKALLGKELPEDVMAILKGGRERFCKQEKMEKRGESLKQLREKNAPLYPAYFDEILQGGFFYLYDHLIQMKQMTNHSEREIREKQILSFSAFSHIILEFKEAVLVQAEKQIIGGNKIIFLLGDTGSGKSTTLCYLRKDTMVLHDDRYQSKALGTNLIGADDTLSCTLFPNIDVSSDLTIVDFPGFNDTHGKVIAFAIEIALRALIKKYCPQILVISSITDTEARFTHTQKLGDRLKRVLGTLDHCILGLTKYSKDPDFIGIKNIENQQQEESTRPTAEESELMGAIKLLSSLVESMPLLQAQIDEKKGTLLKLKEARVKNSSSPSEEKLRRLQRLKEREENVQEAIGIKNMIQFVDLAHQNQLETVLGTLKSPQKIPPLPKYHQLDPGDKELLDILFKEKLFQILTSSKEHQFSSSSETVLSGADLSDKIKTFEKSILETSLIHTLLYQSHPEVGQFFHLEEMDPSIVREYDKKVINGCIQDYIHEVISHLSVVQEVIKKFKEQFTKQQGNAIDHELSSLKQYILTLYGELPQSSDQDQVNQAWQGFEKEHQKLIKNKEKELELSGFMTVLSLIPLAIPYAIFEVFKAITLGKIEAMSIAKIADQLCDYIKASGRAIRDLQGIEKSVIAKDNFDKAFAKYHLSLESVDHLKSSLSEQIDQIKNIYGKPEWEVKIAFLINQLEMEFGSHSDNVLYGLISQVVSWKELPPYFNEHTYLALMHAFVVSQSSYQESLKLLFPGWKVVDPKSLGLNAIHDFFYPIKITEKDYKELKIKGKILAEQYNRTPITRLLLVEAIIKLKEKSSPINLDETRSFLNLFLQNDLEKIRSAVVGNEWILEYSKKWVRQDKDFISPIIKLNAQVLRYGSNELRRDCDFVMTAIKENVEALRYASEELRNNRDFVMAVIKENIEGLYYASEGLRNDRDFVMTAIKKNVRVFRYASEGLRNNRDFVMANMRWSARVLYYASEGLRNNRDFVMAAIRNNIEGLYYASEGLRNDRDFVMATIKENVKTLRYASEGLRNNRDVVIAAVKQSGLALEYASKELKNDRDIVVAAVKQTGEALAHASEGLRNDRDVVIAAVKQSGLALEYASKELKNDRDVVMVAVTQKGRALGYASKELQNDYDLIQLSKISRVTRYS